jgi:probable addiction module antidote protein
MLEVRQTRLYAQWFADLRDRTAKVRIDVRIRRLFLGNPGDVKPVGEGVSELRVGHGAACPRTLGTAMETAMDKTTPWDPADHLRTDEDMAAYLEAALEDGDPSLVAAALGDIARAKGMTQVARAAGLGRESLYKALSPSGNPEFATILKVVAALGLQLHAAPAAAKAAV